MKRNFKSSSQLFQIRILTDDCDNFRIQIARRMTKQQISQTMRFTGRKDNESLNFGFAEFDLGSGRKQGAKFRKESLGIRRSGKFRSHEKRLIIGIYKLAIFGDIQSGSKEYSRNFVNQSGLVGAGDQEHVPTIQHLEYSGNLILTGLPLRFDFELVPGLSPHDLTAQGRLGRNYKHALGFKRHHYPAGRGGEKIV